MMKPLLILFCLLIYAVSAIADSERSTLYYPEDGDDAGVADTQQSDGCDSSYELAVTCYVNIFRAQYGLRPLQLDANLTRYARYWSSEMAQKNFFDHNHSFGSVIASMASGTVFTENIACGVGDPQTVVQLWANSPEHRANMLKTNLRKIGVARVTGSLPCGNVNRQRAIYATADFSN